MDNHNLTFLHDIFPQFSVLQEKIYNVRKYLQANVDGGKCTLTLA